MTIYTAQHSSAYPNNAAISDLPSLSTSTKSHTDSAREMIDSVYRSDSRRVFATLIRLLGDFDLAEEAMQDAFVAAVDRWPVEGVPANPSSWLVSAGRFK